MTAFTDTIPIDRINTEARDIHFGRIVLTLIAALFYGLGWVTAKVFAVLWLSLAWCAVAVKVGWQEGRASSKAQRR